MRPRGPPAGGRAADPLSTATPIQPPPHPHTHTRTHLYIYNQPIITSRHITSHHIHNHHPNRHPGLRIKENKEVYEGEVTELTPEYTEAEVRAGGCWEGC